MYMKMVFTYDTHIRLFIYFLFYMFVIHQLMEIGLPVSDKLQHSKSKKTKAKRVEATTAVLWLTIYHHYGVHTIIYWRWIHVLSLWQWQHYWRNDEVYSAKTYMTHWIQSRQCIKSSTQQHRFTGIESSHLKTQRWTPLYRRYPLPKIEETSTQSP